jgi:hypothetical protein
MSSSADADPEVIKKRSEFQHLLVMQAHSYTNATFSIAAARAGFDDGKYGLIGCSCTSLRTMYCTLIEARLILL